jgi:hypothetical protein
MRNEDYTPEYVYTVEGRSLSGEAPYYQVVRRRAEKGLGLGQVVARYRWSFLAEELAHTLKAMDAREAALNAYALPETTEKSEVDK